MNWRNLGRRFGDKLDGVQDDRFDAAATKKRVDNAVVSGAKRAQVNPTKALVIIVLVIFAVLVLGSWVF